MYLTALCHERNCKATICVFSFPLKRERERLQVTLSPKKRYSTTTPILKNNNPLVKQSGGIKPNHKATGKQSRSEWLKLKKKQPNQRTEDVTEHSLDEEEEKCFK